MAIEDLITALQENPNLEASTETLLPFVDGLEFFGDWLSIGHVSNTSLIGYKRDLYRNEGSLLNLINLKKELFSKYVQSKYPTLEDVGEDIPLRTALGVEDHRVEQTARALVQNALINDVIPEGHDIRKQGRKINHFFNPEVVGKDRAEENLKKYFRSKYTNLDDIGRNITLSRAVGLSQFTAKLLAKASVERGIFEPKIPDNYEIGKVGIRNDVSKYFDSEVVGTEWALKNLKRYVHERYSFLDQIGGDHTIAFVFGVKYFNTTMLAKKCVEHKIMSPELPDDYQIGDRKSFIPYFNAEIVGKDQALKNIKKYLNSKYETLDDIKKEPIIRTALGLENYYQKTIARLCVKEGFMSAELPDNHPIRRKGANLSHYVLPQVVGEEQALLNIKKYVQSKYSKIEDIKKDFTLSSALGLDGKSLVNTIREKVAELGWLDSDNFRSYIKSSLPNEFKVQYKKENKSKNKLSKKPIGAYNRQKRNGTTTFPKGEALEQLVGLFLSYINADELVLPQYCLDVGLKKGKGYFKTRADFKVGNQIYEVKWGNAAGNIEETFEKHQRLLKKEENKYFNYHLVRLDDQNGVDVPYEMFGTLLESKLDVDTKSMFESLAVLLMESSDKRTDTHSIDFLNHFRDFVYNVIDEANNKNGTERQEYINEKLETLNKLANENIDNMDKYMKENTNRFFAPLEALFEYQGKLYRGLITPSELQKENPERYETRYYFGDVEFTKELDRNLAVMVECSPEGGRFERTLDSTKVLQTQPVFKLPNGLSVSSNGVQNATKVDSLEKAKGILNVTDKDYNFALEYIEGCGLRC